MIPMRDLDDDYYEFDEKNYCLVGRRRHHIYQLGDPIRIKVARANLERKQLDFTLADDVEGSKLHPIGENKPTKSHAASNGKASVGSKGKSAKRGKSRHR